MKWADPLRKQLEKIPHENLSFPSVVLGREYPGRSVNVRRHTNDGNRFSEINKEEVTCRSLLNGQRADSAGEIFPILIRRLGRDRARARTGLGNSHFRRRRGVNSTVIATWRIRVLFHASYDKYRRACRLNERDKAFLKYLTTFSSNTSKILYLRQPIVTSDKLVTQHALILVFTLADTDLRRYRRRR